MVSQTNYLKLMAAIAGGIVAGGLALWLASILLSLGLFAAVFSGLEFTTNESPKSAVTSGASYQAQVAKERHRKARVEQREAQARIIDSRRRSPDGRRLHAQCDVWRRNAEKTPTRTTRAYASQYCDQYDKFLQTGRVSSSTSPR